MVGETATRRPDRPPGAVNCGPLAVEREGSHIDAIQS